MIPNPCELPGADYLPACAVAGGIEKAADAVDAATDPFGYMAVQLQKGALGLSEKVLPALQDLTHPDLTVDWFTSAYSVSFALAVFVWVGFLGWNFVLLSRRRISGDDVTDTLVFYTPMFFIGAAFGPLFGTLIVSLVGAVSDSVIAWGVNGSVGTTVEALNKAIELGDPNEIIGGAAVALFIFAAMMIALFLAFIMLLVLLVTQYLAGVVFPLSLVWLNSPTQRSKGIKVLMIWLGICVSHVLVFLMLGVAFRMVSAMTTVADNVDLKILADLVVAVIALLLATLSPLALLKFAPVGASAAPPTGRGSGRSGERSGGGSQQRDAPDSDSQTGQMGRGGGKGDEAGSEDSGGADGSSSSSTGGKSGLSAKLEQATAEKASSSASMESGGGGEGSSSIGAGVGAPGGKPIGGPGGPTGGSPLSASSSGGSSDSSAGEGATKAGKGLSQAGQAADATGVGAPAGVAMQAVGMATEMAGLAAQAATKTSDMAQDAGELAGDHMEYGDNDGERRA